MLNINLAHVRNMLHRNYFGREEKEILLEVSRFCMQSESPFSSLIEICIQNCFYDITVGNFESAAREINFIHNLPMSNSNICEWDEHFFYLCEIPSHFEMINNKDRIKFYIYEIAKGQKKVDESNISPKRR